MSKIGFTKSEIAYHKWKLIQEGLSPDEANKRIIKLIEYTERVHREAEEKKKLEKPNFTEEFRLLKSGGRE